MNGPELYALLIALLIVLMTIVFTLYKKAQRKKQVILLTGLCNTGKTLLFSRLIHRKFISTQTSIKENIGEYIVQSDKLRVVDIPGHERLREKYFDAYKGISRAIIYVIDSQNIQKDVRDIAEYLYNILCDSEIVSNSPKILLLCNKQDLPFVKASAAIKNILEKELNTLRITKSSQLDSVGAKGNKAFNLGSSNETFSFNGKSPYKFSFIETYATNSSQETNISALENWLTKL